MSLEEKIPPLPTGEHPWARRLKRTRRVLSAVDLVLSLALTAVLLGPYSFRLATAVSFERYWLSALAYAAALSAIYGIVLFPVSFIRSYVVEKRFGLSTQTLKGWFADAVKGLLVGAVLGTIVLLGLVLALAHTGTNWWWIAAAAAALFGVILTRLAPQLILPLFFKLKPLDAPELQQRFKSLAERTATPVLGIFEIDMSRRTKAANAAVIGFGATRKAVVGDTLLKEFSPDEVEFVLAHELGHHRHHDLWYGVALGAVSMFAALFVTHAAISEFAPLFAVEYPPTPAAFNPVLLFWISVLVSLCQSVLGPVGKTFSRFIETRADRFATEATRNPGAGAAAFRKLGYQNLAVFNPPRWEELLFFTHPAIGRRIARLEQAREIR